MEDIKSWFVCCASTSATPHVRRHDLLAHRCCVAAPCTLEKSICHSSPLVVEARNLHTMTVIMLHGIGDSGKGWASIADDVDLPQAKWIFPNAKARPLTATYGKLSTAWADMSLLSIGGPDDEQGTMETKDMIHRLIAEEVRRGIPAHRIFIGGFSQGGAMACVAALTHKQPLAGCFVLSGYITMHKTLPFLLTDEGRRTPFFQVHMRAHTHARAHSHTPLPRLCTLQWLCPLQCLVSQETFKFIG